MLKNFIPDFIVENIYEITPDLLKSYGILGVMVDLDNTLATYHEKEPDERIIQWVKLISDAGITISIISNNNQKRVDVFNEKLGLHNVASANKPFRKVFLNVAELMKLKGNQIAVVGDQIYTDVLGGNNAGMFTIMVNPKTKQKNILLAMRRILEDPFIRSYERRRRLSHNGKKT